MPPKLTHRCATMGSMTKTAQRVRLDQLLVERGLAETRSRAQALILGGRVRVGEGDGARTDRKAGDLIDAAASVHVLAPEPYVSRGGHKLAAALDAFGIDPKGLVCLDVGASTGGFSDVLLQRGAGRLYAVDVGRGQLAERVRTDPRVVVRDRIERPVAHRGDASGACRPGRHRRLVHLARSRPRPGRRDADGRGDRRAARQAPVRGGPRPDRAGHRPRSRRSIGGSSRPSSGRRRRSVLVHAT